MKKVKTKLILILFCLVCSGKAIAQEELDWGACIKEAAKNHPDLIAAQQEIKQSESSKQQTASGLFPQIIADAGGSRTKKSSSIATDSYSYGASGTQLIFDGAKTINNVKAAQEDISAAKQGYRFTSTKTMSLLLGAIAAISLLVGGIGIMNIMLVSVTERTREIGLRKAIGATNKDIMVQFLIEAILMSFLGGVFGVSFGWGIATLITIFAGWSVKVSLFSVLLSTIFSLAIGIIFGLWPAKKASGLDPIEALRYE